MGPVGVGGHIAHIVHIAWSWGRVERVVLQRVAQLCVFGQGGGKGAVCQSGGLATICTRSVGLLPGLCPQKAGPGVANYWPLHKALKLSAMEIALSDPNFRFSRAESLTHCAVERATQTLRA